jgi:hypothetical protein
LEEPSKPAAISISPAGANPGTGPSPAFTKDYCSAPTCQQTTSVNQTGPSLTQSIKANRIQINIGRHRRQGSFAIHQHALKAVHPESPPTTILLIKPTTKSFLQLLHKKADIAKPPLKTIEQLTHRALVPLLSKRCDFPPQLLKKLLRVNRRQMLQKLRLASFSLKLPHPPRPIMHLRQRKTCQA